MIFLVATTDGFEPLHDSYIVFKQVLLSSICGVTKTMVALVVNTSSLIVCPISPYKIYDEQLLLIR